MNEKQLSIPQVDDRSWKWLYYSGGVAALAAVLIFRRNFGAELTAFNGFGIFNMPPTLPVSAAEWFALLIDEPFVGMAMLGLIDLVNYALVGLIFLALFGALRKTAWSAMVVATISGLVGIAVFWASNQVFAMLTLSKRFAEAAPGGARDIYLAAGEALLAVNNHSTGTYLSLFLVLVAGLIISIVMLRSDIFGTGTAVVGIIANGLALGYFITLAVAPEIIWLPPTLSAPLRIIWYILIAIKLFQLDKALP